MEAPQKAIEAELAVMGRHFKNNFALKQTIFLRKCEEIIKALNLSILKLKSVTSEAELKKMVARKMKELTELKNTSL